MNRKHSSIESHLDYLSKSIDSLSSEYDDFILLDDFNLCMEDSHMKTSAGIYKLQNLLKKPTCFKNPENPACIHFILTNELIGFKNTYVIETGLSDFHKKIVAVMKMHFSKMKPSVVSYWKYKYFCNKTFLDSLRHELNVQGQFLSEKGLDAFSTNCTDIFDRHTCKKSNIYDKSFNTNEISKAIMTRSR